MSHLFSEDQCILKEVFDRCSGMAVVEEVSHKQRLVHSVPDNGGGKVVEAKHVSHFLRLWVLGGREGRERGRG